MGNEQEERSSLTKELQHADNVWKGANYRGDSLQRPTVQERPCSKLYDLKEENFRSSVDRLKQAGKDAGDT